MTARMRTATIQATGKRASPAIVQENTRPQIRGDTLFVKFRPVVGTVYAGMMRMPGCAVLNGAR